MKHSQLGWWKADSGVAVVPNNQIVILPPNQSEAHIEDFSRSNLYPVGKLAPHGRHDLRHGGV